MRTPFTILALTATAAAALTGCGSSSSATTTSTATTTTSAAACSVAAIQAATASSAANGETRGLIEDPGSYHCADGWATAFYTSSNPNGGDAGQGVIGTVVFKADGANWTLQDRAKVCAKPSPVPPQIYENACNNPGETKDTGPDQAQ